MSIEARNISYTYPQGAVALRDVSLHIGQGERVALLGHNGSGKSTLAKHFNGLLRPCTGEILINGAPTAKEKVARLSGLVGLSFQNPDEQICKGTVWDEAAFGPTNLGYDKERVRELARASLTAFGLLPEKDTNPHDLGYSERKRLALASILAMDTGILVLDEPTAGLDPGEIALLEAVLRQLESEGKIVVIISHDMDFVAENMSRAICLENGCKRFDGGLDTLFADQDLMERCGLLPPQVVRLSQHFGLRLRHHTPEGFVSEFAKGC